MDNSEKIKELWNQAFNNYDSHMLETGHYKAQRVLYERMRDYFQAPVLDLAGGPGFLASLLLEDKQIVFFNDFSIKMTELAKEKFKDSPDILFYNQDASTFSIGKKFRTIICCNLFYYLQDRKSAIKNWGEILTEDGTIILFEEYPFQKPNTKKMEHYEKKLMSLINPLSPKEIEELFNNNFILIEKFFVPIDTKHDLFCFIFKKS